MKLFEYVAKGVLARHGIPVPEGFVVSSASQIRRVPSPIMVKAQVLAGGRGKAGGLRPKGIVFHGTRKRDLADPPLLKELAQGFRERTKDHPTVNVYKKFGTPMLVSIMNTIGAFPTQYWSKGTLEGWEGISAESLLEKCDVSSIACPHCHMACGKISKVKKGRHRGLRIMGPQYETIHAFGGLCMVKSIEEIIYLNDLCDRLGIDTITAGNLVAFAIEASKKGKTKEKFEYGDVDGIAQMLIKLLGEREPGASCPRGFATPLGSGGWKRKPFM